MAHLQKLRHPRLVSFLGRCDRPPHIVLLMEFMSGGSLHNALFGSKPKKLSFADKARIALHITEGLSYLHDLSPAVVHRDLKTMNIVLDENMSAKICDFGLTFSLDRTHLTVMSLQGSPRYMAPEQLDPPNKITEKVDIWQMGCVMLELFCLAVPFAHCSTLPQIVSELLVRRRGPVIPPDADPRARALIGACLKIMPNGRPTATQLEVALSGVFAACQEAAPPRSVDQPATKAWTPSMFADAIQGPAAR